MKKISFFSILLLVFFIGMGRFHLENARAEIPESQKILDRMEKKYAGKDFFADFHQISTLTALEITETASGKVFFSHPGKMRWEYLVPTQQQIISNGRTLWIYRPDENQAVKGSAQTFFNSGAGGAFLSNISLVKKRYNARIKPNPVDTDYITLILEPKKASPDIESIHIRILKANDHIVQVTTHNPYGDTTTLDFWNIVFNKIDVSIFEFITPDGVDVIDMQ
ncbi:outer membrane lipoprotein carrier protein [Desulfocicer vacuolatum DSM 3385]|uniref:Outer-membrane lipoprotein carrier protein n=1 Tax=Desulfocicer vacuolatum DSM 3385 TaxID=1121400 RepID=A0A1W2A462_9BACT|nr:outer membrane lipoprotein chaperone LolA [Desulfocicer vacuolatum]SMC55467.1 outer membrane lipoprotein carrier protein [Desulfocicer vacuolatum DSM 3385]